MAQNYYKCENREAIKVLDFGCGAGANTWYLANKGFSVAALDGSEDAISNTKMGLDKFEVDAQLVCADCFSSKTTGVEGCECGTTY